ncbi:MAG: TldD/PmbA family protein [Clostridia bacterium]|nr:TldD/PmbA family protein [Clostridia bacterium]
MIKDILTPKKIIFAPDAHTELRGQVSRSRNATIVSGVLTGNSRSDISGISARVYKNGVYGFSSMAEYSPEAAEAVLRAATENAEFMDLHVAKGKPALPCINSGYRALESDIDDCEQKFYVEFAREIDSYIAEKYKNLASRMIASREDSMEKLLRVSNGVDAHTCLQRSYVYVFMNSETPDGKPVELFKAFGGEGGFNANFSDPKALYEGIDTLYENLMKKREGVYADAGEKTVVLGGMMTGMLAHEAVGHTVEADLVLGGSVSAHNLGKQVASEKVSLTDFANTAFGEKTPLPVYVDDEGVEASDARIIENGILVGYMNNRESAQHFGMTPCGNARAWAFSDEPLIRMRNTAVLPGSDKLEDIIASVDDGYYLIDSSNGQADTTGEFMFGVSMGYEIKNGKLGRALLDTTISGVAFEMLKTVDMVSDTVTWSSSGFCGKKQPMPVGMGGPAIRCKVIIGGR